MNPDCFAVVRTGGKREGVRTRRTASRRRGHGRELQALLVLLESESHVITDHGSVFPVQYAVPPNERLHSPVARSRLQGAQMIDTPFNSYFFSIFCLKRFIVGVVYLSQRTIR